jgi:hypothetical protein
MMRPSRLNDVLAELAPHFDHIATCLQLSSLPFTPQSQAILVCGLRSQWPNNFPAQRLEFVGTTRRDGYQFNVESPEQGN